MSKSKKTSNKIGKPARSKPVTAVSTVPPEPTALTVKPMLDRENAKWYWSLREGKVEHHESDGTFESEGEALADGEKWLAQYTLADADQRRAALGWKPSAPEPAAKKGKTKEPKSAKPKASGTSGGMSCLDAAVKVLGETKVPMTTKEMIEAMLAKGYWKPRSGGKTPAATLYSAILREVQKKGSGARFKKTDRGLFALTGEE